MMPATEAEARAAIETEDTYDRDPVTRKILPRWLLFTPHGWCWSGLGTHANMCFSAKEAREQRRGGEIERCEPGCQVCEDDDE